ncbi:hypothetical protein TESG_08524 [Trichophyton tonsurans CBS 112818]|uniref:Uncharacterized protein n=2 Tax=Trichophyton TaxID=5550 RepID=F2PK43_TRIEC|nr:hypothetical protein TESG_08524 [Trichophyton tonsurans CBS 112818]EGE02261.1 hypothetical protein TEQG_08600 [Trichophyton equinum CBS 127.97]
MDGPRGEYQGYPEFTASIFTCLCRAWYIFCSAGCIATVHPSRHAACRHDGGAAVAVATAGRHDCDRGMALAWHDTALEMSGLPAVGASKRVPK